MYVTAGRFKKIYDPSRSVAGSDETWYINDHGIIRSQADQRWHLFGITHPEPASPLDEKQLAHATCGVIDGQWRREPDVMEAEQRFGETHLWAPHVIWHEGLYYMFYCAGGADHARYRIHLATSQDLWQWERSDANPLIEDGYDARDPMVLRIGNRWVMYYTANEKPQGGRHVVCAAESHDLLHWSGRQIVFADQRSGTFGGPCESPFVVERGGRFYLFCGPRDTQVGRDAGCPFYSETGIYMSDDPLHFQEDQRVGSIPAHAAEVIFEEPSGRWWITHCGWGQGGLYLAELHWHSDV